MLESRIKAPTPIFTPNSRWIELSSSMSMSDVPPCSTNVLLLFAGFPKIALNIASTRLATPLRPCNSMSSLSAPRPCVRSEGRGGRSPMSRWPRSKNKVLSEALSALPETFKGIFSTTKISCGTSCLAIFVLAWSLI